MPIINNKKCQTELSWYNSALYGMSVREIVIKLMNANMLMLAIWVETDCEAYLFWSLLIFFPPKNIIWFLVRLLAFTPSYIYKSPRQEQWTMNEFITIIEQWRCYNCFQDPWAIYWDPQPMFLLRIFISLVYSKTFFIQCNFRPQGSTNQVYTST